MNDLPAKGKRRHRKDAPAPATGPQFKSAIRTSRYVARYLYQILIGCGYPECTKTYCKSNIQTVFKEKVMRTHAAVNLAMYLSSLRGDADLCEMLRRPQLPMSVADYLNEDEPLESFLLKEINYNSKSQNNSENQESLSRTNVSMWANVKSVVPSSAYGDSFLKTHEDTISLSRARLLKRLFEIVASTTWQRGVKRTDFQSRELMTQFAKNLQLFDKQENIYITRHLVNSINGLYPISQKSDELDIMTIRDPAYAGALLHYTFHSARPSTWPYLNLRISRPFCFAYEPTSQKPILENTEIREIYQDLSSLHLLKAWPLGLNIAPLSLQYPARLLSRHRENLVSKAYPEFNAVYRVPRAKLPPIASAYFNPHLQLPFYAPRKQKYTFLTDSPYHSLLSFQERVDLLRYVCLRRMSNCIQQSIANRSFSLSVQQMVSPLVLDSMYTNFNLLLKIPHAFIVTVSRDNMIKDAIKALRNGVYDWDVVHRPLKVQFSQSEQLAVDQGGVQVEFFNELGAELIKSQSGYFQRDEDTKLAWFFPGTKKRPMDYEYIGMLCGLAVYNGCTISVEFPLVLYKMIKHTAEQCKEKLKVVEFHQDFFTLEDMEEIYPSVARSFKFMLNNKSKVASLDIPYQYHYTNSDGMTKSYPLKSSRIHSTVTGKNVERFVKEYVHARLFASLQKSFYSFYFGFMHFLPLSMIRMFSPLELRTIVEGTKEIDVLELKAHTTYDGFTFNAADKTKNSPTIEYFWNIVEKFNQKELADLLEFVTGTDRIPSGGMEKMEFIIQKNGTNDERLPSSSVCFSRLLLPEYNSEAQLEKMLRLALKHSVGFGLI